MTRLNSPRGSTLLDEVFVSGVVATLGGITVPQRLVALDDYRARGVDFGALPNLAAVDQGGTAPGTDPVRLGLSNMASFSANGTSSTGTLYVHGRGTSQYAIRIYGETGKTRILKFEMTTRQWKPL